jgi:dimethylaniline monooxygenase (N-oxide forming)
VNKEPLLHDKKFVVAILPSLYYPQLVKEKIIPLQDQLVGFTQNGIKLRSGQQIPCDMVVLALGNQTPSFPFLPQKQRWLMEREGGVQLYRHVLHPQIKRLGFVGFNHCYMHLTAVEIGTLWLIASWRGDLVLPSVEVRPSHLFLCFFSTCRPQEMEASTKRVSKWKDANMAFEPTRAYLILTRFQQYLDTLLQDLDVNPYRKMPNFLSEVFARYEASDYSSVIQEYDEKMARRLTALKPCEHDT